MNLYTRKKRWKIILSVIALLIISASIYYTNLLVNRFAIQERTQIRVWAESVQRRAGLMRITEEFFSEVREQERQRIELFASAYRKLQNPEPNENLSFYLEIISNNTSIPVIITNENRQIQLHVNLPDHQQNIDILTDDLLAEYTVYEPIPIALGGQKRLWVYYKESLIYTELKTVLDDLVSSFFDEVALNAVSVPVIITDSSKSRILQFGNLDSDRTADSSFMQAQLADMASENNPITIEFSNIGKTYIFYR
ncbi:MAG: hypothetical protein K8F24_04990, partial [Bacteroidales bacterium]|nr:hypothetical protein [Bacteroidales bacterium]